jgi:microcin C transport system substrate-binding protein
MMTVRPLGLGLALALGGLLAFALPAGAEPRHGWSTFGDLKYPAGFEHFDYVNPDAPKGGRMITIGVAAVTTFDSFNPFIARGDAAQAIEQLVYDSLMARAMDEPDALYGLVAGSIDVPADGLSATFRLRPEARFADATPVTAADVVFSFEILKEKGEPQYAFQLRDVVRAEALDPLTVRYTFQGSLVRDLPGVVAALPIFPKAFYAARDFAQPSLEPPLGSGPYRLGTFDQGAYVTYVRRADYWGKDLPVNRGRFNFDEIRLDYYRDRTAGFEAFSAGKVDFREEFVARDWATAYDIPAVRDGRILREEITDNTPSGTQGYLLNKRRDKFKDPRVREALGLAFDFEWTRKQAFYGAYQRTDSYFENSDLQASGAPTPEELALLEPFRASLPPAVFGEAIVPPVTDGSGPDGVRKNLLEAARLLDAAGWTIPASGERVRRNAKGEAFEIEFLDYESSFQRITSPYVANLAKIGIRASMRTVDPAQYQRRFKSFDFDVVTSRFVLRLTPGVELRNYWGSSAASAEASANVGGIAEPAVDALIEKVVAARSRAELKAATGALDRVLRAGYYWVPHWFSGKHRIAYWNKFSRPPVAPLYDRGVLDTWWLDAGKAAKLPASN